jgi:hypothetical protein
MSHWNLNGCHVADLWSNAVKINRLSAEDTFLPNTLYLRTFLPPACKWKKLICMNMNGISPPADSWITLELPIQDAIVMTWEVTCSQGTDRLCVRVIQCTVAELWHPHTDPTWPHYHYSSLTPLKFLWDIVYQHGTGRIPGIGAWSPDFRLRIHSWTEVDFQNWVVAPVQN